MSISAAVREALSLIEAGNPQEAWGRLLALGTQVDCDPPAADRIRRAKGVCARMFGEAAQARDAHEAAISWHRTAAELVPEVPGHRLGWAWALIKAGMLEDAWSLLSDLSGRVANDPGLTVRVRRAMGSCARMIGDAARARNAHDAAISWHTTAAELVPEVPGYRLGLVWALINAGMREDAWSLLSDLSGRVADDPDLTERVRRAMGRCAESLAVRLEVFDGPRSVEGTNWVEAGRWRLEAIRRAPDRINNWERYAWDLIYSGCFAEAKALIADAPSPEIAEVLTETIGDMPRHLQAQIENGAFIYGTAAPRYLGRGLPVVPAFGKVPIPRDWEEWSDRLPDESVYRRWLEIPWANIGLVLGPKSGVSVIDIDTDDPELIELIRSILPPSPWCRIGQRGMALAYRWTELPTLHYVEVSGRTAPLLDYLSAGAHILLPPSLHPKTGLPYWANRELLDVLDDLAALPDDFADELTQALKSTGRVVRVSPSARRRDVAHPASNHADSIKKLRETATSGNFSAVC